MKPPLGWVIVLGEGKKEQILYTNNSSSASDGSNECIPPTRNWICQRKCREEGFQTGKISVMSVVSFSSVISNAIQFDPIG